MRRFGFPGESDFSQDPCREHADLPYEVKAYAASRLMWRNFRTSDSPSPQRAHHLNLNFEAQYA